MSNSKRGLEALSPGVMRVLSFGNEFALMGQPWPEYVVSLGLEPADIPALIEIVATRDLSRTNRGFSVEECGPRHAWRALGQLRAASALPALLEALVDDRNVEAMEYQCELPRVIGLMGPPSIPHIDAFTQRVGVDWGHWLVGLDGLMTVVQQHTECQPAVEKIANSMLGGYRDNSPYFNAAVLNHIFKLELLDSTRVKEVIDADMTDFMKINRGALDAFIKKHNMYD